MTPESSKEQHLTTIAEMAIMRILFTCLVRQSPNVKELLVDFEQCVEEQRHQIELSGSGDERFDLFAERYTRWIAVAGNIPRP
jgi:hypothetical protein